MNTASFKLMSEQFNADVFKRNLTLVLNVTFRDTDLNFLIHQPDIADNHNPAEVAG